MANPIEVSGKIIMFLEEKGGQGKNGPWKSKDFVIETEEQYPKKICLTAWGEKVDAINSFSEGDAVKCSINIESREYNDNWYTTLKIWKLEGTPRLRSDAPQSFNSNDSEDPLPF